jgi:hypothetical protein
VCIGILNAAKGLSGSDGFGLRMRKKEGVHNVHTRGFGFGCTGVRPGRMGDVFGGVADYQGERLGPLGGLFHWWPVLWPSASCLPWIGGPGRSLPVHGRDWLGQHDLRKILLEFLS